MKKSLVIFIISLLSIRCVSDEREACYRDKEVRTKTSHCDDALIANSLDDSYIKKFFWFMCLEGLIEQAKCNKKSNKKPIYDSATGSG